MTRDEYLHSKGAVDAGHAAYWIESEGRYAGCLIGLRADAKVGDDEIGGKPGPYTQAFWDELQRSRQALKAIPESSGAAVMYQRQLTTVREQLAFHEAEAERLRAELKAAREHVAMLRPYAEAEAKGAYTCHCWGPLIATDCRHTRAADLAAQTA